jgi:hypothetical protein
MVEIFCGLITRQAIRRASFASVSDLENTIRTYIDSYNESAHPFRVASKPSNTHLLGKIKRKRTINT